jgi:putative membrane protein
MLRDMNRSKGWLVAAVLLALPVAGSARDLNAQDESFVRNAWMTSMAEFKLGKLAEKRGQSKFVRQFGTMMATHHKTAYEQAAQLAKAEMIELPKGLDKEHQDLYKKLSGLRGSSFDKAYKAAMFKGHREAYASFTDAGKNASNSNVKNFAIRYTPIIAMHLEALQTGKLM